MHITFKLKNANTNYGEQIYVVGNKLHLGQWKVSHLIYIYILLLTIY
jgi:hypothetical protein